MNTFRVVSIGLAMGLGVVGSGTAFGQEPAEVPAAPDTAAPAATVADTGEAPAEEDSPTAGWFRVDTDSLGTQFWLGASHEVGGIALASDIYVVGSFAELDLGPSFTLGDLALTPMVGIGFDFATTDVASLIAPQLFSIYSKDKIYFESWIQVFLNSIFTDGAQDIAYTRNFLLYKVAEELAVGPQVEVSYSLNEEAGDVMAGVEGFETGVVSLPVGGRINLGYGKNNTLGLFVGYETKAPDGADAIAGRFTFIRTW